MLCDALMGLCASNLAANGLEETEKGGDPVEISGIYPHLAMFNNEGECGGGAVVPWADRLWVITYGPHCPWGSSDKLYEITPDLRQIIRPESVGGTPAGGMIHDETGQLLIGPYLIDEKGKVRMISGNWVSCEDWVDLGKTPRSPLSIPPITIS